MSLRIKRSNLNKSQSTYRLGFVILNEATRNEESQHRKAITDHTEEKIIHKHLRNPRNLREHHQH